MPTFVDQKTGVEYVLIPNRFVSDRRVRGAAGNLYMGLCLLCSKAGLLTGTVAEIIAEAPPRSPRCERSFRKAMQRLRELGYVVVVKRRRGASTYFLPDMVMEGQVEPVPATCRGCNRPTPPFEQWCSSWCRELHRLQTDPAVRRRWVYRRDGGVCALCRVDTNAIEAGLKSLLVAARNDRAAIGAYAAKVRELVALGFNIGCTAGPLDRPWWRPLWEADHILAIAEGGGVCDLSNLRTLCVPCHKGATAELRARLPRRTGVPAT